jgi:PKD repeat protein
MNLYHVCGIIPLPLGYLSMVWCGVTSKSLRWIVAGILLLLVLVLPVSAGTRTVISPGATVYIGEQGLDISPVTTVWTRIVWWDPSNTNFPTSPTYGTDVEAGNFAVDPAIFSGRTGRWYAYDTIDGIADTSHYFTVADPSLSVSIVAIVAGGGDVGGGISDVTGKSVLRGTDIGFQIPTNLIAVADGLRSGAAGDVDQNVRIRVRSPSGAEFTTLIAASGAAVPLSGQWVTTQPFYWTDWNTGALTGGLPAYEYGTYTVWSESTLNGMIDNYKNPGGGEYLGKTRSQAYTFTMIPPAMSITAAGTGNYYFGEGIRFSGTNYRSATTYLFLVGPGLPAEGAQMVSPDPKNNPVVNGDPATFAQADVLTDQTWSRTWTTAEDIPIDPGIYTVYASSTPADYYYLSIGNYVSMTIQLERPFIVATVDRSVGPVGTVFHFTGTKEGGASPAYYTYLTMTNNTPPTLKGSLPASGVRPDNLAVTSVTGSDSTFGRAEVLGDRSWSYDWDTSGAIRDVLLPGSVYRFYILNRPYSITDAQALPYPPVDGYYNRATYTKLQVGIEGPVTASFTSEITGPTSVKFTDTSTGIPTTVSFDFGDKNVASVTPGGTIQHTYASAGTYTVTQTAGNSLGSDTEAKGVTLLAATRDQATAAVISGLLGGNTAGKTVYTSLSPVAAGTLVQGWSTSFTPRFTGWLVIIDDTPKANWEHPVRWVQKADNDQQEVTLHTSMPKNVALSRTGGDAPIIGGTNDIGSGYSGGNTGYGGGTASCANIECTNCYALLVSGGFDRENNFNRYYDDLSAMYRTLRQTYCYPEDHIYVLMSDGQAEGGIDQRTGETTYADSPKDLDGLGRTNDIFGPAGRADLEQVLRSLRGDPLRGDVVAPGIHTLEAGDDLFIFTTNHGGKDPASDRVRLWLWDQEFIWDDEFAALLDGSRARSITMTMEQCYSGGFVDNFMGSAGSQTRVITTAASPTEPSYGNDFSFWWIEGATGPANQLPKGNEDRLISFLEGFGYAVDHDPSAAQHLETPMYGGDAGESWSISSCSRCPDPVALSDCPTCLAPQDVATTSRQPDGIYEDLDGNGQFTMEDVRLFFTRFESMKNGEPACAFDTNGNGRLDFVDVVNLYTEVQ